VIDLTGQGAVYHRVSGEAQDLDRQREATSAFLRQHKVSVPPDRVFEDINWARDEADVRPAFQRLMKLVEQKRVNWIVIDHRNRWGMRDKWQRVEYVIKLRKAGCRLYTSSGEHLTGDSLLDLIQTGIDGEASEKELREKAEAVVGGKVTRAADGEWMGGYIPYGCCVVCVDRETRSREKWRVEILGRDLRVKINADGARERFDGENNFPPAAQQVERLELRPSSDEARLQVVRDIYNWYLNESIAMSAIARRLNKSGILTAYGLPWRSSHVQSLLCNPIYTGRMPFNRHSEAKYTEWIGGRKRQVAKEEAGKFRKRDRSEWVLSRQLFEPIIDPSIWEAAQKKMAREKITKTPRSGQMWLSGLLYCGHCGRPMRSNVARQNGRTAHLYVCASYSQGMVTGKSPCGRHFISHEEAEQYLRDALDQWGVHLAEMGGHSDPNEKIDVSREPFDRLLQSMQDMQARLGLPDDHGLPVEQLMIRYAQQFRQDQPGLSKRLKKLQDEHDLVTQNFLLLKPGSLAQRKAQERLDTAEAEINEIQALLDDAGERCLKAWEEVTTMLRDFQEARAVLMEDVNGRTKAEVVSKIIKKIELTYRPTGRKKPMHELAQVKVFPAQDGKYPFVTGHRLGDRGRRPCVGFRRRFRDSDSFPSPRSGPCSAGG
jgi:DNA invertase Pin-like site-specific DNA recombinase